MTVIEKDYGWVSYEILEDYLYIQDLYISPKMRQARCATKLARELQDIAKENKCKRLTTSINTSGKIDVTRSMNAILSFGFEFLNCGNGFLTFEKVIL